MPTVTNSIRRFITPIMAFFFCLTICAGLLIEGSTSEMVINFHAVCAVCFAILLGAHVAFHWRQLYHTLPDNRWRLAWLGVLGVMLIVLLVLRFVF